MKKSKIANSNKMPETFVAVTHTHTLSLQKNKKLFVYSVKNIIKSVLFEIALFVLSKKKSIRMEI